jgi:hypothetical protein
MCWESKYLERGRANTYISVWDFDATVGRYKKASNGRMNI